MSNSKFGMPAIVAAVVICLACVCCAAIGLYFYGDTLLGIKPQTNNPPDVIVPANTSNLPEWTVIVYADADDEILEADMWFDVNEMELVGSTPQMNIVVQLDRAVGAFNGDGVATAVAITPQIGDTFEDYVQSYYFNENNESYFDYSLSGDVFTYGEKGFWYESRYPVDGEYAIGFYAVDFDNNIQESYEYITYQK